jgi:hypothetical protein
MGPVEIIVRTKEQDEEVIARAVKRALMELEEDRKRMDNDVPQELETLLEKKFPAYNTDHFIYKLRQAVKTDGLGVRDRYNKYMVSYNQLYNYLFNRKSK